MADSNPRIKVIVATHKEYPMPSDGLYTPLPFGAFKLTEKVNRLKESAAFLQAKFLHINMKPASEQVQYQA